jgi:Fe2+ or Zn2+ uptake regulation protein
MQQHDSEILKLSQVYEALKHLNKAQVYRIIHWAEDRFGLIDNIPGDKTIPVSAVVVEPTKQPDDIRQEEIVEIESPKKMDFKSYESASDLFAQANVKRTSSRIVLMAAYLHEKQNLKEISSKEISSNLKRQFPGIKNVASLITNVLKKNPPLMLANKKDGASKQARKKYYLTDDGFRVAMRLLSEGDKRRL